VRVGVIERGCTTFGARGGGQCASALIRDSLIRDSLIRDSLIRDSLIR
jgi:hypothetical protein